jgi:hypothetical protein
MVGHGGGATADGGGGSCKCVEGGDVVTRDLVGVDSEASTTPSPVPSMKEGAAAETVLGQAGCHVGHQGIHESGWCLVGVVV